MNNLKIPNIGDLVCLDTYGGLGVVTESDSVFGNIKIYWIILGTEAQYGKDTAIQFLARYDHYRKYNVPSNW